MDTCFLFTEALDESGCLFLKLAEDGSLLIPPGKLGFDEIERLQQECKTLLVEPCSNVTLLDLNLPWLSERKARAAIPYALEDQLAQPVEQLHFAFDKLRYHNNHYLVAVIGKERMNYLLQTMDKHFLSFDMITIDWFALPEQTLCVSSTQLLINQEDFQGSLSGTLALSYLKQHPHCPPLLFQNSQLITDIDAEKSTDSSYTWIARQLLTSRPLNLCQGEMQHGNASDWLKKGYQFSALACGIWLLSILFVNGITLYTLNQKTADIDAQIAVIYHQFFPEAKQVISPKFRISQLLKSNDAEQHTRLWFLVNTFAKTIKDKEMIIEQMRYQNNTLSVTITGSDFATLEHLENDLKKAHLHVKQTEASTHDQQVIATLELT